MHWRNSNFQIKYFIAGSCHTPDEAYRKLMELKEEREMSLASAKAGKLKLDYDIAVAEKKLLSNDKLEKMQGEYELAELKSHIKNTNDCVEQAKREYDYIISVIEEIKPFRKYSHLPDYEAFQIAQEEEWLLELKFRAENFLASIGTIPHDHLATMRMHPQWNSSLNPFIQELISNMKNNNIALSSKQLLLETK